jgi:transcription elongation factor GreA
MRAPSGVFARPEFAAADRGSARPVGAVDEDLPPSLPFRAVDGAAGPRNPVSGGVFVKDVILTPEGYEQLKAELDRLRTEERREIAERIAAAREFGEIAENAEYDDAKNEQMMLEHRIAQLEERLADARVIDTNDVDTSVVSIGSVVRLRDVDAKETVEYFIVGSAEANPAERKLSNESPVGKAIIGRKKGETVEVVTPRGSKVKFKIMEIKAA